MRNIKEIRNRSEKIRIQEIKRETKRKINNSNIHSTIIWKIITQEKSIYRWTNKES